MENKIVKDIFYTFITAPVISVYHKNLNSNTIHHFELKGFLDALAKEQLGVIVGLCVLKEENTL